MRDTEKVSSQSQQQDDKAFRQQKLSATEQDLGSRSVLADERDLIWYPAEVNTSIRPGWFYHREEDNQVRSLAELIKIYINSVGGNATFLLNIPPTKEGLLHQNDVNGLAELGDCLKDIFKVNLLNDAKISVDSCLLEHVIEHIQEDRYDNYFRTEDGITKCELTIKWTKPQNVRYIVLKENILCSQRVERFRIETEKDGKTEVIFRGTVIGYKRIVALPKIETDCLRVVIEDARVAPILAFLGIY